MMNRSGVPEPHVVTYVPKHYLCRRATEALVLDGKLDKPFWQHATWTDDFVDIEGDLRPLPAKQTRVKMLWDDEYFYFGAELIEDQIWGTLTERDSVIFYDNDFEIFIDPTGASHQYYEFEINALNTVWDLLLVKPYRDGGPPVNGWDIQGLKTAVHIEGELNNPHADQRKWTIEVAMPWRSLKECAANGQPPTAGEFWRVNFSRVEWRTEVVDDQYCKVINPDTGMPYPEDNWVWSPQGIINMHYPELWGYVMFVGVDGPQSFDMPADELVKWQLRKLYYRERNYYEAHGHYAVTFELLRGEDDWSIEPHMEITSKSFHISALTTDGTARLYIREDGLLWKE